MLRELRPVQAGLWPCVLFFVREEVVHEWSWYVPYVSQEDSLPEDAREEVGDGGG